MARRVDVRKGSHVSVDAIVLEHPEDVILGTERQTVLKLAPLAIGRGHVIWAKGSLFVSNSKVTLELEAQLGGRDVAENITFNEKHGTVTFALAVATTLPGEDEDLFVAATLQAFSRPFVGGPETGLAVMHNAKLVDLAVDSVSVQQV